MLFYVGEIPIVGKSSRLRRTQVSTKFSVPCTSTGCVKSPRAPKQIQSATTPVTRLSCSSLGVAMSGLKGGVPLATTPVTRQSRSGWGVVMSGLKGGAPPTKPDLWTPSLEVTVTPSKVSKVLFQLTAKSACEEGAMFSCKCGKKYKYDHKLLEHKRFRCKIYSEKPVLLNSRLRKRYNNNGQRAGGEVPTPPPNPHFCQQLYNEEKSDKGTMPFSTLDEVIESNT